MSSNSGDSPNGGGRGEQPAILDYITYKCPVCGRTSDEEGSTCHPPQVIQFERRLATGKWLLPFRRPPNTFPGKRPVLGGDNVSFECLYASLRPVMGSNLDQFEEYINQTPYQIASQQWIASIYRQHLEETDELVTGLSAAIEACETRVQQETGKITPSDVFAHLVFLDQYGLIPGCQSLSRLGSLREFCAENYDVGISNLHSKWVVERRVDRSKVFSTTKSFREELDLELTGSRPDSHPYAEYKPFDGTSVLGDHRDHNLVTRQAKQDLLGLPHVDWAVAPHIFYSRPGAEIIGHSTSSELAVVGFDFAGFEYTPDGQKLRYLGIVTAPEEDPFEVYLQIVELGKTDANGIVIMPNRQAIYDFLHFLRSSDFISETESLPESLEDYHSIPNVRSLHQNVVKHVRLLNGIALVPRRKFLDECFRNIGKLIGVATYA